MSLMIIMSNILQIIIKYVIIFLIFKIFNFLPLIIF